MPLTTDNTAVRNTAIEAYDYFIEAGMMYNLKDHEQVFIASLFEYITLLEVEINGRDV